MKNVRAIVTIILSALAAFGAWQILASNISIQIGGSNNKVEQKIDLHY
jgi:hypothetical protein